MTSVNLRDHRESGSFDSSGERNRAASETVAEDREQMEWLAADVIPQFS